MIIPSLILYNFRLFSYNKFTFENNITFITGKNNSGKSSIIESLYIIKSGRSYRTNSLNNCIKYGEKFFSIEYKTDNNEKFIYTEQGVKSFFIDEIKTKKKIISSDTFVLYNKNLFSFIFNRDFRRKTIDELISTYDNKYLYLLINYKKLNEKKKEIIYSEIDFNTKKNIYESIMKNIVEYTFYIVNKRKEIIQEFNLFLKDYNNYKIEYKSEFINLAKEDIYKIFNDRFFQEIEQKRYTGPHNDYYSLYDKDFKLIENGASSDFYKFYFYLYLFFINKIKLQQKIEPIILFDDFFLPLDLNSSQKLLSFFDENDKIVISQHEYFETGKLNYCLINL